MADGTAGGVAGIEDCSPKAGGGERSGSVSTRIDNKAGGLGRSADSGNSSARTTVGSTVAITEFNRSTQPNGRWRRGGRGVARVAVLLLAEPAFRSRHRQ